MLCVVLTRFFAILLLLVALETVVFVHAYEDLIALRGDPAAIADGGDDRVRDLAATALARRHVTRRHLETLSAAAHARKLVDIEVASLERLRQLHTTDKNVALQLADAYRRAKQFDAATAVYRELLEGSGQ